VKRYRCTGAIHGPPGDCLRPVIGAVFCYGYLDLDDQVPLEESLEGPVPLLIPACELHRVAVFDWAHHLWGEIADGFFVPAEGIPRTLEWMRNDGESVVIAPDPSQAVLIRA
jgi:hypothetical protein